MTTTIPVSAIGPPKSDIIDMAFEDCRLSGFDFDRTPEESLMALRRLNAMMSEWPWSLLGYDNTGYGEGGEAELSNLPPDTVHGVSQALALRLMTAFGKAIPDSFRATAAQSFAYIKGQYAVVPRIPFAPGTLRGAGARFRYGSPYFPDYSVEDEFAPAGDPGDLAAIASS